MKKFAFMLIASLLASGMAFAEQPNLLKLKSGECTFTIFAHDGVKLVKDAAVQLLSSEDASAVVEQSTDRFGKCSFTVGAARYVLTINGANVAVVEGSEDNLMTKITVVLPEEGLKVGGQANGELPAGTVAGTTPTAAAPAGGTMTTTTAGGLTTGTIVAAGVIVGLVTWGIVEAADDDDNNNNAPAPAPTAAAGKAAVNPLDFLSEADRALFNTLDPRFQTAIRAFLNQEIAKGNTAGLSNFRIQALQPPVKAAVLVTGA